MFPAPLSKRDGTKRCTASSDKIGKCRDKNDDRAAHTDAGKCIRSDLRNMPDENSVDNTVKKIHELRCDAGERHLHDEPEHRRILKRLVEGFIPGNSVFTFLNVLHEFYFNTG